MMIDASHANSGKKPENQPLVIADIARQISGGEQRIVGVMIESNLVAGRQDVVPGTALTYGQSITDGCIDWDTTVPALNLLADAVAARREMQRRKIPGALGLAASSVWAGRVISRPAAGAPRSAAAADALDLAVEGGVFLAQRIVRIAQILLRRHVDRRAAGGGRPALRGWAATDLPRPTIRRRSRSAPSQPARRSGPAAPWSRSIRSRSILP